MGTDSHEIGGENKGTSLYVDHLLKQQDAMTTMLRDMVEMESPSDDKQAVYRLAQYKAGRFDQIGANVEFLQPNAGDHLRASWGSGDEQVLVLCHLDTVWPAGELARRVSASQKADCNS